MANPGRDQRGPMERLVRIAAMLQAHPELGVSAEKLNAVAGFPDTPGHDQLKRDIRHLEHQGWRIENIAPAGQGAVYRMRTVDNRLRVRLSLGQQAALRRAMLLADNGDLVQRLGLAPAAEAGETTGATIQLSVPAALRLVVDAVRDQRLLRFDYKGVERVVHPESVRTENGVWYLRGVEDPDPDRRLKTFVVSRMLDVDIDAPRSARPLPPTRHAALHPMSWEIDPPVEVTLRTAADFEPDVRRWLGEPLAVEPDGADVLLRYRVTHKAALHARLVEIGDRVRVVGPPEAQADLVAFLETARGEEAGA
ncbi:WYL domain-containing protein [Nocardioides daeguensis]|uniref:WYL domain-containing protein n=1 Tax=Nocardioides daeguensis TaxID=908359 RepID=A0ABP6UTZ4_9ACTN|nr:WYL domain-containing protein [Nocardioides daeguensis]MBV6729205.1 WYL domain-containing protein [Nocardioides daeguensis]MCR1774772.1 WYL domain-containing protein [Nocardioides daeguensis]